MFLLFFLRGWKFMCRNFQGHIDVLYPEIKTETCSSSSPCGEGVKSCSWDCLLLWGSPFSVFLSSTVASHFSSVRGWCVSFTPRPQDTGSQQLETPWIIQGESWVWCFSRFSLYHCGFRCFCCCPWRSPFLPADQTSGTRDFEKWILADKFRL